MSCVEQTVEEEGARDAKGAMAQSSVLEEDRKDLLDTMKKHNRYGWKGRCDQRRQRCIAENHRIRTDHLDSSRLSHGRYYLGTFPASSELKPFGVVRQTDSDQRGQVP